MIYHQEIACFFNAVKDRDFLFNSENKILFIASLLHAADISNSYRPIQITITWTNKYYEELYNIGDKKKELGLPISEFEDRTNPKGGKRQSAFIDNVIRPFLNCMDGVIENTKYKEDLEINYNYWRSIP